MRARAVWILKGEVKSIWKLIRGCLENLYSSRKWTGSAGNVARGKIKKVRKDKQ